MENSKIITILRFYLVSRHLETDFYQSFLQTLNFKDSISE